MSITVIILLILALALLIAEAFIPLFGIWGVSGLALLITAGFLSMNAALGIGAILGISFALAFGIAGFCYWGYLRYRQAPGQMRNDLIGKRARVIDWDGKQGRICVDGLKNYHAASERPYGFKIDDVVVITAADYLSVSIQPLD